MTTRRRFLAASVALAGSARSSWAQGVTPMLDFDFRARHDAARVLRNPGKGWYHHLFDNGIDNYKASEEELLAVPGLDHIYLRLAWSYIEPQEGQFNWKILDEPIAKWTAIGLGVAFCITCKETAPDRFGTFATPEWVKDAGARGEWVEAWGSKSWLPDYADPIFLKYLDAFHRAFGARYGRQKWLRYVVVGSYGQWGEGHNWMAGDRDAPVEALHRHVEIYREHYAGVPLIVSDDIAARKDKEGQSLALWIEEKGLSWRDDSVLVKHYADNYAATGSVRAPEQFERVWRERATVLELQHYGMMKNPAQDNTWRGRNGSEYGADLFRSALEKMHASYIGYHGYAREWLGDNPDLTGELANKCGYWLFPLRLQVLGPLTGGSRAAFKLGLENRGVAPPYKNFQLKIKLDGPRPQVLEAGPIASRTWLPGAHEVETSVQLPNVERGKYLLSVGVFDGEAPVQMALREEAKSGFHAVGEVSVA